jgi:hypothetical protein
MSTYQIYIIISALINQYSLQELERGVGIVPILVRQFGCPQKIAKAFVRAASETKKVRVKRHETEPEVFYLH